MIERLKFRGKATIAAPGEWMKCPEDVSFEKFFKMVEMSAIDPATVGQFTGMKDCKGVDIYEGDICRNGDWENDAKAYNFREEVVEFLDGTACFCGWNHNEDGMTCEVIGNIHDEVKP